LTRDEVNYLHQRNCKIALVYNGIDPRYDNLTTHGAGRRKAEEACRLARSLDAPGTVRIYADLEGWAVDPLWIRGWCDGLQHSEYVGFGGIYGRVVGEREAAYIARRRPNFAYWSRSIEEATGTTPEALDELMRRASHTGPPRAGHRADTSRWRVVEQAIAAAPRHDRSLYVWANTPRRGCNIGQAGFDPNQAPGQGVRTVIWQYGMACWRIDPADQNTALIDMDMANDEGLQGMW
jgi:hypothetical protein